jgi:hypothetical protein
VRLRALHKGRSKTRFENRSASTKSAPFRRILDGISTLYGLKIVFDEKALRDDEIDAADSLAIEIENISLKSALNILCRNAHVVWLIENDAIVVTAPSRVAGKLFRIRYPISDILESARKVGVPGIESVSGVPPERLVVKFIADTVAPASWEKAGGKGAILYDATRKCLDITQTEANHDEIFNLLASIRAFQEYLSSGRGDRGKAASR